MENSSSSPKINIKDIFCDYTSISGVRFLHSRHPRWFRYLSSFVLIMAIFLFFFHISNFILVLITNQASITFISLENDNNIIYPSILLCPEISVLACQWLDETNCITNINLKTEFGINCVEIISKNSSFKLSNLLDVLCPIRITLDYSDNNPNQTKLYLKVGRLSAYDYVESNSKGESLNAVIDQVTENLETTEQQNIGDTLFYDYASFSGDATRLNLDNSKESKIAEITINFREGTFHQTALSDSYTLLNLTIDLGSSLSLYFGFTVLTLFEIIIFFFYGRSDEIINLYPPPSKAIIYDLPNRKMMEKRSKNDIKRKLAAEKQRQQNFATMLPPIY